MAKLDKEQEVIMNIADMAMDTFIAESALLRAQKLLQLKVVKPPPLNAILFAPSFSMRPTE